eukprot:scaffold13693_cov114-Skeletonema_marinoi.AAC.1
MRTAVSGSILAIDLGYHRYRSSGRVEIDFARCVRALPRCSCYLLLVAVAAVLVMAIIDAGTIFVRYYDATCVE